MGWLQVAHEATAPPNGSDAGQVLRWYRKREKLTQQEMATRLNTTQSLAWTYRYELLGR